VAPVPQGLDACFVHQHQSAAELPAVQLGGAIALEGLIIGSFCLQDCDLSAHH
jgi:hypothetical protein